MFPISLRPDSGSRSFRRRNPTETWSIRRAPSGRSHPARLHLRRRDRHAPEGRPSHRRPIPALAELLRIGRTPVSTRKVPHGGQLPSSPLLLIVGPIWRSRERYASCAAAADFRVEQAHNGLQALDKATTLRPDIILTDLSPSWGLDGLALCRRLGDAEVYEGNSDPSVAGEQPTGGGGGESGVTSVLVKPCSPERLLVEIIRVLSRTQRVGLVGEREDHHITADFTRSLWTALSKNARLTIENADLAASAELWADWHVAGCRARAPG